MSITLRQCNRHYGRFAKNDIYLVYALINIELNKNVFKKPIFICEFLSVGPLVVEQSTVG